MAEPSLGDVARALALGLIDLEDCAARQLPVCDPPSALAWLRDPTQRAVALSASFDPGVYLERYHDIAAAQVHPLIHYLRHGMAEGRDGFPVFAAALAGLADTQRALWIETHDLSLTGAPLALSHVLQGWPDLANSAILGTPCHGPLGDHFAQLGCHVVAHAQSARRAATPQDADALITRCRRALQASGVAAVIGNSALAWPMICAALALGLPTAWIIHEPDSTEVAALYPPTVMAQITACLSKVDRLIFVSRASRVAWGAAEMAHASVIEKALPPQTPGNRGHGRQAVGCGPQDVLILSVGSISPRKGQADLLAALSHLSTTPIAARLVGVLVGYSPNPYAAALRQELATLRQAGMRVFMLSESRTMKDRRNVAHLFAAADIFVMSSRAESLPLTTAEALAAGCPVITTDVPGIGEMIANGETGLHYTPGDIAGLAQHIQRLADEPELRAGLRKTIAQRPPDGGFARMIAGYQAALGDVVAIPAAASTSGATGATSSR